MTDLMTHNPRNPVPKAETVVTRGPAKQGGLPKRGAQPNAPFELTHHPNRWNFTEDLGFYPVLGRFHHEPGLGGVDSFGDLTRAEADLRRRGWSIIYQDDDRLQGFSCTIHGKRFEGGYYLRRYAVQGGGYHYRTVFERPHVVGNIVRKWIRDDRAFRTFVDHLVEHRLVAPLDPLIKDTLIEKRESAVHRLQSDLFKDPRNTLLEARLREQRRVLAMMRGESVEQAIEEVRIFAEQAAKGTSSVKDEMVAALDAKAQPAAGVEVPEGVSLAMDADADEVDLSNRGGSDPEPEPKPKVKARKPKPTAKGASK